MPWFIWHVGASAKLVSLNITVPEGSQDRGNPRLICLPTTPLSIITFFAGNYFAHAATVLTRPSAPLTEQIAVVVLALLCPASGLARAIAITSRFSFRKSVLNRLILCRWIPGVSYESREDGPSQVQQDLRTAARAAALCTLIRTRNFRPQSFTGNKELANISRCFVFQRQRESPIDPGIQSQLAPRLIWKLIPPKQKAKNIGMP